MQVHHTKLSRTARGGTRSYRPVEGQDTDRRPPYRETTTTKMQAARSHTLEIHPSLSLAALIQIETFVDLGDGA